MVSICTRGGSDWILEKNLVSEEVVRHWNRLLRETVESLSLGASNKQVDMESRDTF